MSQEASRSDPVDPVDRIQAEWARSYPHLDVAPIGVLGRIQRVATVSSQRLDRNLERHGVSRAEFDLLGALARADEPIRASEVVSTTLLSAAYVTKLSDALVRRGLIRRRKSARDGRVVLLEITESGQSVVDEELPQRLADDEDVLADLSAAERETLVALLRKVSRSLSDQRM
ncbi:MarR family winged helix-turn-helix transcriptional regulator [Gordonia zhaorongruii]|uniref:MarR family winged helix-turn-helix transcriptional regulator n=1 Tax=Gordonia zhaorongruii TaxID=2597659 RepID=UPI00104C91DA|nr:MarR family transcriptional regulator [Gordonia zhaorongruii]